MSSRDRHLILLATTNERILLGEALVARLRRTVEQGSVPEADLVVARKGLQAAEDVLRTMKASRAILERLVQGMRQP